MRYCISKKPSFVVYYFFVGIIIFFVGTSFNSVFIPNVFANATCGPLPPPPGASCVGEACGGAPATGGGASCVSSCPAGQTGASGGVCQNLICSANCKAPGTVIPVVKPVAPQPAAPQPVAPQPAAAQPPAPALIANGGECQGLNPVGGVAAAGGKCSTSPPCPMSETVANGSCASGSCCENGGVTCTGSRAPAQCAVTCNQAGGVNLGQIDCPNGQICCHQNPIMMTRLKLQGIGNGINADGTPENTTPQSKTITATVLVNGSTGSTQNTTTANQNQTNTTQGIGNTTGTTNAGTQQSGTGMLTYNQTTGLYENLNLLLPNLSPGTYKMIMHVAKYLDRPVETDSVAGTITLVANVTANPGVIDMVPGDIAPQPKGDNIVDLQDYNTLVSCMGQPSATVCPDPKIADLNGDGVVDQKDLNLLQSHFGATGASFTTQQFVCTQDPTCANGNSTIQMCPLQCKIETIPTK